MFTMYSFVDATLCTPVPLVEIYRHVILCMPIISLEMSVHAIMKYSVHVTSVHALTQYSVDVLPQSYLIILPHVFVSVHVPPQASVITVAVPGVCL